MRLTKTEQRILSEIATKGYAVIQHGINHAHALGRVGTWGTRDHNAMVKLIKAGKIRIVGCGTDRDAHRGRSCVTSWAKVEPIKGE